MMSLNTPAEIAVEVCRSGKAKTEMPLLRLIVLGILAGVYVGFGANLATKIGSAVDADSAMGIFLYGAVFSVGLMLVVIGGAELFTGNNMTCFVSALKRSSSWGGLLYNWSVVFAANFAGSLLLVCIIYHSGYWQAADTASGGAALSAMGASAAAIAKAKLSLTWMQAFLRGISCNWLVCLAVWLAYAARDIAGKILAIFFPIMAFVSSGFEHSVANMFFIPMGIFIARGAPAAAAEGLALTPESLGGLFTIGALFKNLLPVTLGNIAGGALFTGGFYWFVYLKDRPGACPEGEPPA